MALGWGPGPRYRASMRPTIVALLGVLATGASAARAQTDPTRHLVLGSVATRDGSPVAGANVFLLETLDGGLTDAAGGFGFRTTFRGAATLVVRRIGYREHRQSVQLPASEPLRVVTEAQAVRLPPITVAAGKVLATDEPDVSLTTLTVATTPGAAADVYRAIQTFPGLQTVDEGAGLFVRGGDVSETRVLLDDALVISPYKHESPTGGFFGSFSPFLLDGIFFSTGGFGARYGDALSGVGALRTQGRPAKSAGGATVSLAALSGTAGLALPDNLGVRATATRSHTGLMFDLNGTTRDFTHVPEGRDLSGGVQWKYRPSGEVRVFGMDQWSQLGVVLDEPSFSGSFNANERNDIYVARWQDVLGPVAPVLSLSTAGTARRQEFGSYQMEIGDRFFFGHGRAAIALAPAWALTVGGEVERRRSTFEGTVPDEDYAVGPDARSTVVASTVTGTRHALFVETGWHAVNPVLITAGLRTDRSSLARTRTWDPRVAAAFRLFEGATLTAAWGIYHQVPAPFFYEPTTGDPALPPMRATHWIAGGQLERVGVLVRLEAYAKTYQDLAQRRRDRDPVGGGTGASQGVDAFVRVNALPGFDLRASYSYIHARRTDPDAGVEARSPFDITHVVSVILERTFANRWRVSGSYRYATGRPFTPVLGAAFDSTQRVFVPAYGDPWSERLPAFRRFDLSGSYLHRLWPGNLTVLFVGLTNAFDTENVFGYRYSEDYATRTPERSQFKRAVYFGASLTF